MVLVALALATGGGCSSSASAVPYADFYQEERAAACQQLVHCGQAKDQDSCLATNIDLGHGSATEISAVASGRTKYDADAARKCVDALAARSCDITDPANRTLPADCLNVLQGTVGDSGACVYDGDCISKICHPSSPMASGCYTGTCVGDAAPVQVSVGDTCDDITRVCDSTSYCDFTSLVCAAFKTAGATCESSDECGPELYCLSSSGTCGTLPPLGEACDGDGCRDLGTVCSSDTGTCVKAGLPGDECLLSTDCSIYYVCDQTSHTCSDGIAVGQPCAANQLCAGEGAFCQAGSADEMGTCALPAATGAACLTSSQCESNVCDPDTLTCVADTACE
jgi:hypothetical protein